MMFARIDTEAVRRDHPIDEVVGRYGIALRRQGRALTGRCPFHKDRGRPNLTVYPGSRTWYCFRCGCGGDAISFVERMEGLGFRDAVAQLQGNRPVGTHAGAVVRAVRQRPTPFAQARWEAAERACLAAAVELYHHRLLSDAAARAYVEQRGIDSRTIEQHRVGYASGDELVAYLRWRRLPVRAAVRTGLLRHDGQEFLANRIVVPEIRAGQPIWLTGRTLDPMPGNGSPKYLCLPGPKPLLGWETAVSARTVWVTEGPFDWLALRSWGLPALALIGVNAGAAAIQALSRFGCVILVLDNDDAGRTAAAGLARALGPRAETVTLPGVEDVAELAVRPDGRDLLLRAAEQMAGEVAA